MWTSECQSQCPLQGSEEDYIQQVLDLDLRGNEFPTTYILFLLLFSSYFVKFPVYIHMPNKDSALSLNLSLSLKVPNVIYMKDSFPDCMSCQMEDSCREVASNVSQGMKQRLDCGNQGY